MTKVDAIVYIHDIFVLRIHVASIPLISNTFSESKNTTFLDSIMDYV